MKTKHISVFLVGQDVEMLEKLLTHYSQDVDVSLSALIKKLIRDNHKEIYDK